MTKKRVNKSGYVYLLESKAKRGSFKFGCTTLSPKKRCLKINSERKGFDFEVIASFKSFDIFKDESNVRHDILPLGLGRFSEFFSLDYVGDEAFSEIPNRAELIKRFFKYGGVVGVDLCVGG